MRIGIFSQWYEPEPGPAALPAVLGRALVEKGHEVHVLTGFPNYPSGKLAAGYRQSLRAQEHLGGVHIVRVPLYLNHSASALRRVGNYASFAMSATALGVPAFPAIDALWVNYSPVTIGLPMWLQQLMRGTPTVCEVGDLWPDTLAVAGLRGATSLTTVGHGLLSKWCNAMYASSDAVSYISPGVGKILESRGVRSERLHYIPKSADESVFYDGGCSLRGELAIDENAIVLLYAGAMGTAQGLETLMEACSLIDDPRLVVLLAGSGTHEQDLRRTANRLNVSNVRFLGRVAHSQMSDLLATADVGFVSLVDHPLSSITMPSKTQSTLASGTAILAVARGDLADLVATGQVGFTAIPGNIDSVAEALRRLLSFGRSRLAEMGRAAGRLYEAQFSVARTTAQAEELLMAIAGPPRSRLRRTKPADLVRS